MAGDVGPARCPFCYVVALGSGENWELNREAAENTSIGLPGSREITRVSCREAPILVRARQKLTQYLTSLHVTGLSEAAASVLRQAFANPRSLPGDIVLWASDVPCAARSANSGLLFEIEFCDSRAPDFKGVLRRPKTYPFRDVSPIIAAASVRVFALLRSSADSGQPQQS
jgi:hypothetical protein